MHQRSECILSNKVRQLVECPALINSSAQRMHLQDESNCTREIASDWPVFNIGSLIWILILPNKGLPTEMVVYFLQKWIYNVSFLSQKCRKCLLKEPQRDVSSHTPHSPLFLLLIFYPICALRYELTNLNVAVFSQ